MTRDEALKKMQAVKSYMTSGNPIWSVTEIGEAFDMAIEALELPDRKTGEWIRETKHYKDDEQEYYYYEEHCSECGVKRKIGWGYANFCPNCGAMME